MAGTSSKTLRRTIPKTSPGTISENGLKGSAKLCQYVTVEEAWFQTTQAHSVAQGILRGRWRDGGEVAQVWWGGQHGRKWDRLGQWVRLRSSDADGLAQAQARLKRNELLLVVDEVKEIKEIEAGEATANFNAKPGAFGLTVYQAEAGQHGQYRVIEHEIVRLVTDYSARLKGLFDTDYLAERVVTVVGLGSGGSRAALELARCGVGYFRLVDFDRLKTANLARHVCGVNALGRYKTRAVAALLRQVNPNCRVETLELDIVQHEAAFAQFMAGSDLVIGATDSEASKLLINRLCWQAGLPSVYGAAYNRAFGGDVVRVIPPETACYYCFQLQMGDMFSAPPEAEAEKEVDYGALGEVGKVKGEPGLGLDVGFIALILARLALHTLLRGSPTTLTDIPTNGVMWGNQPIWLFEKPLESLFIELERSPACPVCQPAQFVKAHLDLELEGAALLTKQLVATAPSLKEELGLNWLKRGDAES